MELREGRNPPCVELREGLNPPCVELREGLNPPCVELREGLNSPVWSSAAEVQRSMDHIGLQGRVLLDVGVPSGSRMCGKRYLAEREQTEPTHSFFLI